MKTRTPRSWRSLTRMLKMIDPSDEFMEKADEVDKLCRELFAIEDQHLPIRNDFLFGGGIPLSKISPSTVYYAQVIMKYRELYPMPRWAQAPARLA